MAQPDWNIENLFTVTSYAPSGGLAVYRLCWIEGKNYELLFLPFLLKKEG